MVGAAQGGARGAGPVQGVVVRLEAAQRPADPRPAGPRVSVGGVHRPAAAATATVRGTSAVIDVVVGFPHPISHLAIAGVRVVHGRGGAAGCAARVAVGAVLPVVIVSGRLFEPRAEVRLREPVRGPVQQRLHPVHEVPGQRQVARLRGQPQQRDGRLDAARVLHVHVTHHEVRALGANKGRVQDPLGLHPETPEQAGLLERPRRPVPDLLHVPLDRQLPLRPRPGVRFGGEVQPLDEGVRETVSDGGRVVRQAVQQRRRGRDAPGVLGIQTHVLHQVLFLRVPERAARREAVKPPPVLGVAAGHGEVRKQIYFRAARIPARP